jgi:hypothetical protein
MSMHPEPPDAPTVPIEAIHVGDFVYLDDRTGAGRPSCVVGLTTTRHRQTNRVIGWLVELAGGTSLWLRRGTRVRRLATASLAERS